MKKRKTLYWFIVMVLAGFFPTYISGGKMTLIIPELLFFVFLFETSVHHILDSLIPSFIPFSFKQIGTSTFFSVCCIMMICHLLEAKGRVIEELSESLSNKH